MIKGRGLLTIAALMWATLQGPATAAPGGLVTDSFQGRERIVYAPQNLADDSHRALVIVLHGALGNAGLIARAGPEHGLNLDAAAEAHGFVVAYLNGTPVALRQGPDRLGWNAGACCGQPVARGVDDMGYIRAVVADLTARYGIDPKRVFGLGHSNGAMMTQRLVCEAGLYAAAVAVSGPLEIPAQTCPAAKGARVLAIHGEDDRIVPVEGGRAATPMINAVFASEAQTQAILQRSGADYTLQLVKGAGHPVDTIDAALKQAGRPTVAETAVQFFGLDQ